jgi:hypothetical protein
MIFSLSLFQVISLWLVAMMIIVLWWMGMPR